MPFQVLTKCIGLVNMYHLIHLAKMKEGILWQKRRSALLDQMVEPVCVPILYQPLNRDQYIGAIIKGMTGMGPVMDAVKGGEKLGPENIPHSGKVA